MQDRQLAHSCSCPSYVALPWSIGPKLNKFHVTLRAQVASHCECLPLTSKSRIRWAASYTCGETVTPSRLHRNLLNAGPVPRAAVTSCHQLCRLSDQYQNCYNLLSQQRYKQTLIFSSKSGIHDIVLFCFRLILSHWLLAAPCRSVLYSLSAPFT